MQVVSFFIQRYPRESLITFVCLVLALSLDALGLSATLPLIRIAMGNAEAAGGTSALEAPVLEALDRMGIAPTLGAFMGVVATAFTLKAVLVLLAKRKVGYTVAHFGS